MKTVSATQFSDGIVYVVQ